MANRIVKLGEACVDSGQLMVTDPCYLGQKKLPSGERPDYGEHESSWDNRELGSTFHYDGACNATMTTAKGGGQLVNENGAPVGVVFRTGYGDGSYPVYAEVTEDGLVASIMISFVGEVETIDDEHAEGAADGN